MAAFYHLAAGAGSAQRSAASCAIASQPRDLPPPFHPTVVPGRDHRKRSVKRCALVTEAHYSQRQIKTFRCERPGLSAYRRACWPPMKSSAGLSEESWQSAGGRPVFTLLVRLRTFAVRFLHTLADDLVAFPVAPAPGVSKIDLQSLSSPAYL